ncbi:MAG TPA: hypothetical protein VIV66_15360, partial [Pyrinomonadaceae bacterium]
FLEYLAPRDGRAYPADERANDLVHWQTSLVMGSVDQAVLSVTATNYSFVSSGLVTLSDHRFEFNKSALIRDPDGHVMALVGN